MPEAEEPRERVRLVGPDLLDEGGKNWGAEDEGNGTEDRCSMFDTDSCDCDMTATGLSESAVARVVNSRRLEP